MSKTKRRRSNQQPYRRRPREFRRRRHNQVDKRSRVEGCDPGSSLGHAHPHGGATTSSASANGCRGKTFPRARGPPPLLPAVHVLAVCMLCADLLFLHMMLSLCVCTTPQSMSLHRSPGRRRGGSKVQKSRVAFKRSFRLVGETSIVQGNFAFSGCQMSKIFSSSASGRRGHAPHGRRGQVFCSTVKKCDSSIPSAENGLGAGVKLRTAVTLFARVRDNP